MKKVIKNILNKWYLYLLITIISVFSMTYLTSLINSPKNEETISIFVASCSLSYNKLFKTLNENKPNYLREIEIKTAIYFNDVDFDILFTSFAKGNSDIVIIPETTINEIEEKDQDTLSYYYTPLNEDYIKSFLNEDCLFYDTIKQKDHYGLCIKNSLDDKNKILDFADENHNENYYAFLSKDSLHAGLNNNSKWETSMNFLKLIIDYEE